MPQNNNIKNYRNSQNRYMNYSTLRDNQKKHSAFKDNLLFLCTGYGNQNVYHLKKENVHIEYFR